MSIEGPRRSGPGRSRESWLVLLPLLVAVLAWNPVMPGALIGGDAFPVLLSSRIQDMTDFVAILQNRLMEGYFPGSFYRPVSTLLWATLYRAFELNPLPYALLACFLHAINSALVTFVASKGVGRFAAIASGVLFALHPVAAETLPYLARLPDILGMFVALVTIGLALSGARHALAIWFGIGLLVVGIKETMAFLPIVLFFALRVRGTLAGAVRGALFCAAGSATFFIVRAAVLHGVGGYESGSPSILQGFATIVTNLTGRSLCYFSPGQAWSADPTLAAVKIGGAAVFSLIVWRFARGSKGVSSGRFRFSLLIWAIVSIAVHFAARKAEPRYLYLSAAPVAILLTSVAAGSWGAKARLPALWLIFWQIAHAPPTGSYSNLGLAGSIQNQYLQFVAEKFEASPNARNIDLGSSPWRIIAEDFTWFPYESKIYLLPRRSIEAYARLRFHDRDVAVHVRPVPLEALADGSLRTAEGLPWHPGMP